MNGRNVHELIHMKNATQANEPIDHFILQLRGQRVMLDASLASLYGVPTGSLVQAVKRNTERFPRDFMFQLTEQELVNLKSQTVISSSGHRGFWGGRRTLPYAFSEQGVAMLSSVLHSTRAIAVNIAIMRAFARLREFAQVDKELAKKLDELESRVSGHDRDIANIVRAIRELTAPPEGKPKRPIGFIRSP